MKNFDEVKDYILNNMITFNNVKEYELKTINDTRKSFYGKAIVKEINNLKLLYSYNTLVCAIYEDCYGIKYMLNYEIEDQLLFSNTTLRHIKEFILQNINVLRLSNMIDSKLTKKDIIKNNNMYFI